MSTNHRNGEPEDTVTLIAEGVLIPLGIIKKDRWRIWGQNLEIPMDNKPFLVGRLIGQRPYGFKKPPALGDGTDSQIISTNTKESLQFTLFGSYRECEQFLPDFFAALSTDESEACQLKHQFRLANTPEYLGMGTIKIGSSQKHRSDIRVETLRSRTSTFKRQLMDRPELDGILFEP